MPARLSRRLTLPAARALPAVRKRLLRLAAAKWLISYLFGDDIFISYSRYDGTRYAEGLAKSLSEELGFSCRLDSREGVPGLRLPKKLLRGLRRSRALVIVATDAAARSKHVRNEVRYYKRAHPDDMQFFAVDFGGAFAGAIWFPMVAGLLTHREEAGALGTGEPSQSVITNIEASFKFRRRNRRLFIASAVSLAVILSLFALGGAATVYAGLTLAQAAEAKMEADEAKREALRQQEAAAESAAEAERQREAALYHGERATAQTLIAEHQAAEATRQTRRAAAANSRQRAAERRTREARAQERAAREEAVRQGELALARRLAAQSDLMRDPEPARLQHNLLLALESMKLDPALDSYRNVVAGVRSLARPLYVLCAGGGRLSLETERLCPESSGEVRALAASPDGKYFAAVAAGAVWLWPVGEAAPVPQALPHRGPIKEVSFSRSGKYMATAGGKAVRVWELSPLRELPPLAHDADVADIAFSPDEQYLAAGAGKLARAWRLAPRVEEVAAAEADKEVSALAFSPDSARLVTGSHGRLLVWEVPAAGPARPLKEIPTGPPLTLDFSPDGKYLASLTRHEYRDHETVGVRLWRAWDYAEVRGLPTGDVGALKFSPDGRYVATLGQGIRSNAARVDLWDLAGDAPAPLPSDHYAGGGKVRAMGFSADGKHFATTWDTGESQVWQLPTGRLLAYAPHRRRDNSHTRVYKEGVVLSPGGEYLAVGDKDEIHVWAMRTGWEGAPVPARVTDVVDAEGELFAAATNRSVSIHRGDGSVVAEHALPRLEDLPSADEPVRDRYRLSFSHDGVWFAAMGAYADSVHVCRVRGGIRCRTLPTGDTEYAQAAAISADGRLLAVATSGPIRFFEVSHDVFEKPADPAAAARLRAFAAEGFKEVKPVRGSRGGGSDVVHLAFSPDARLLAVSHLNHRIHLVNVFGPSEELPSVLHHHPQNPASDRLPDDRVVSAFSRDGRYLMTLDALSARTWDLRVRPRPAEVARLSLSDDLGVKSRAYALGPDGRHIVAGGRVWRWTHDDLYAAACARLSRNLTWSEWEPDLYARPYRQTCPALPPDPSALMEQRARAAAAGGPRAGRRRP